MHRKTIYAASAIAAVLLFPFAASSDPVSDATIQRYIDGMWGKAPPEWKARVDQDETQRVCTQYKDEPPAAEANKLMDREKAGVVYPADMKGDWKEGEKVAKSGVGGRVNDKPGTVNGGNCYACHQLAPSEISYGTVGPSLLNYGKIREFKPEEAKAAYAKIYDSQALTACSNMPRFGHNKVLSEQQMRDVLAYLFDKDSPVNK